MKTVTKLTKEETDKRIMKLGKCKRRSMAECDGCYYHDMSADESCTLLVDRRNPFYGKGELHIKEGFRIVERSLKLKEILNES
jgi:hypothetical protein